MALGVDSAGAEPARARRALRASQTAHIHHGFFTGRGNHEQGFVQSYLLIEEIFLGFGFGPLLPSQLRFAGCPPGSEASKLHATSRPNA